MTGSLGRSGREMLLLRVCLSALIAAHGWARFHAAAIVPFGVWLDSQGVPFGAAIAYAITALEIIGTPLLALGYFVLPLCAAYAAIYLAGIVLVHAPEGWFVVGLGRNGMEYSVLLIVCLICVGFQYLPGRKEKSARDKE